MGVKPLLIYSGDYYKDDRKIISPEIQKPGINFPQISPHNKEFPHLLIKEKESSCGGILWGDIFIVGNWWLLDSGDNIKIRTGNC